MATGRLTEDQWIRRWLARWPRPHNLVVGAGDDCAILAPANANSQVVLKTDAIVQDVHFVISDTPQQIGAKAINRVLSDFAAMGAAPQTLMVSVGIPKKLHPAFVEKCYRGMAKAAAKHQVTLAGGETTRSKELWFSVSGIGKVAKGRAVLRSTAKAGDLIFVTGTLGGSLTSKKHLNFTPRLPEGQWLANNKLATAMMDLSDGLGKDLPRLATASKLHFAISAAQIPATPGCDKVRAVNDGEDFELLFTVSPKNLKTLAAKWPFKTKLTPIGIMVSGKQSDTDGIEFQGFDHFLK
jgi:thiamine-monophosphate kinase